MSIRATITVHSAVDGKRSRVAKIHLWNDGAGTNEIGSYRYQMRFDGKNHEGAIAQFERGQAHGAVRLIAMVLNKELGDRPIEP